MSVLKAVVSFYRTGEERPFERYKKRLKVQEEHRTLSTFKKNVVDFLGLNDQATKAGLGSFDLKLYRLAKISGKIENYILSTVILSISFTVVIQRTGKLHCIDSVDCRSLFTRSTIDRICKIAWFRSS